MLDAHVHVMQVKLCKANTRGVTVVGFVVVREPFVGMEPYGDLFRRIFFERALSVGKPPRIVLMGLHPCSHSDWPVDEVW